MSTGNLGGASFTVTADTSPFEAGMKRAQATAKRAAQTIELDFGNLASRGTIKFKTLGDEVERTSKKLKDMGGTRAANGLYAIGAAIDDMQYGFRGVVNNVPQIVQMFGLGSGLAGGAQIAAVAINQLVQHWGSMTDMFRSAWLNVPAEHLEKLRIQAEKATDAFEKLMQAPSKFEARQINAMTEAMTEAGPGGARSVFKGIAEAVTQTPGLRAEMTQEQKDRIANAGRIVPNIGGGMAPPPNAAQRKAEQEMVRKQVAKEMEEANLKAAQDLMGKAILPGEEGAAARATLRGMMEKFPNAFPEDFRKRMAATTDQAVIHHEANARMAHALMRGPLGARMLMGEGDERFFGGGNAMTDQQIRRMLGDNTQHIRLGGLESATMFQKMKDAALSAEEGRAVMGGMRTKDVAAFARDRGLQMFEAVPQMFQERLNEVVGRRGKPMPNAMERGLRRWIKDTGIEADAPGVMREMREANKKRVQDVMLQHGLSKGQAQQFLLNERAHQLQGAARGGQWVGLTQFASMAPEQRLPDLARKQLDELKEIRKALRPGAKLADQIEAAGLAAGGAVAAAIAGFPG